jgi:hypothetical protein
MTTTLPPAVVQYFNAFLLSTPMPKFHDDLETLNNLLKKHIDNIVNKIDYSNANDDQVWKLLQEFQQLYERTQAKEKNSDPETQNETQAPFYRLRSSDRRLEKLLYGLRHGISRMAYFQRNNPKIYKKRKRILTES